MGVQIAKKGNAKWKIENPQKHKMKKETEKGDAQHANRDKQHLRFFERYKQIQQNTNVFPETAQCANTVQARELLAYKTLRVFNIMGAPRSRIFEFV